MKIDLYARCWNEGDMLPFFFLHYDHLVQRYVIYDDGSTDNSQQLLSLNPKVELRPSGIAIQSLELRPRSRFRITAGKKVVALPIG